MKDFTKYVLSLLTILLYLLDSVAVFFLVYIIAYANKLNQNQMSLTAEIVWAVYMILVGIIVFSAILKVWKENNYERETDRSNNDIAKPDNI